jgi:hypothetical protein
MGSTVRVRSQPSGLGPLREERCGLDIIEGEKKEKKIVHLTSSNFPQKKKTLLQLSLEIRFSSSPPLVEKTVPEIFFF